MTKTSMMNAGFPEVHSQKWTRMIVTTHPKLPGYIFKLYLDSQRYHLGMPEYHYWLLRIKGMEVVRSEIEKRGLQHMFKVPKKWIYPLPEEPSPPSEYLRKNFILVEEDMNICGETENRRHWYTSSKINRETITILVSFLNDLGLKDSAKIENIPFSRDGRIAFVDTQSFYEWPVRFFRLVESLNEENASYLKSLVGE